MEKRELLENIKNKYEMKELDISTIDRKKLNNTMVCALSLLCDSLSIAKLLLSSLFLFWVELLEAVYSRKQSLHRAGAASSNPPSINRAYYSASRLSSCQVHSPLNLPQGLDRRQSGASALRQILLPNLLQRRWEEGPLQELCREEQGQTVEVWPCIH